MKTERHLTITLFRRLWLPLVVFYGVTIWWFLEKFTNQEADSVNSVGFLVLLTGGWVVVASVLADKPRNRNSHWKIRPITKRAWLFSRLGFALLGIVIPLGLLHLINLLNWDLNLGTIAISSFRFALDCASIWLVAVGIACFAKDGKWAIGLVLATFIIGMILCSLIGFRGSKNMGDYIVFSKVLCILIFGALVILGLWGQVRKWHWALLPIGAFVWLFSLDQNHNVHWAYSNSHRVIGSRDVANELESQVFFTMAGQNVGLNLIGEDKILEIHEIEKVGEFNLETGLDWYLGDQRSLEWKGMNVSKGEVELLFQIASADFPMWVFWADLQKQQIGSRDIFVTLVHEELGEAILPRYGGRRGDRFAFSDRKVSESSYYFSIPQEWRILWPELSNEALATKWLEGAKLNVHRAIRE